jgi:DNA-binding IclR family transcriptional regulator
MACVSADGTLTASGRAIFEAVRRPASPEQVAEATGLPLYRVRSSLREMAAAGMVTEESGLFSARPE